MNVCATFAQGGQKRASGPLELEVQAVVSCHVGASNQTLILCKSSQCFESVRQLRLLRHSVPQFLL